MEQHNESITEDASKALQAAVAFAGLMFLIKYYIEFCIWLAPKPKRPVVAMLIAIVLPFTVYSGFKILGSPASHPSSHYTPIEWRALVKRKCVAEIDQNNGVQMNVACVALDAPDVPQEIQGQWTNVKYAENQHDLLFVSFDHINIERYRTNDPAWFEHPNLLWADRTRPGVSVLRFWDWSMLDDSKY